jgi:hypothetical protein
MGHVTTSLYPGRLSHLSARRLIVLVVLAADVLLRVPSAVPEPHVLTGTWVGTWWMGKYEQAIELDLSQARRDLVGHVTLWGYPRAGSSDGTATVRTPVTGTVEGDGVQLVWTIPERGQFSVKLTLLSPDTLFGLGGVGSITTGFELHRSRSAHAAHHPRLTVERAGARR